VWYTIGMNTKNGLRIITTYSCNRNCTFCYQSIKNSVKLNPEHLANIPQDFVPQYITVMGGEVSMNPLHTLQIMKALDIRYPTVPKSVTTNGSGGVGFYNELASLGVTNISFSMPEPDEDLQHTILWLRQHTSLFTIRVNCYFKDPRDAKGTFAWCLYNRIPLTLCPDMNMPYISAQGVAKSLCGNDFETLLITENQSIFLCKYPRELRFTVYGHGSEYNNDNWIILPNGTLTDRFKDVMECKGAN